MSDGWFRHDFDLGNRSGTVTVGRAYAVAPRIATTNYEDFLTFAVDDVFRGDGDAFEQAVLLSQ